MSYNQTPNYKPIKITDMRNLYVNLLTSIRGEEERHFVKITASNVFAEAIYRDYSDKVDIADFRENETQYNNCMLVYCVGDAEKLGVKELYKLVEDTVADANNEGVRFEELKNKLRSFKRGTILRN